MILTKEYRDDLDNLKSLNPKHIQDGKDLLTLLKTPSVENIAMDLTGYSFYRADLVCVSLKTYILVCCDFRYSILVGADLSYTKLSYADLRGADLSDIKYNKHTDFANAIYDQYTIFPKGFNAVDQAMLFKQRKEG